MSLISFISFAFFSLLFLGNVHAECVDLTGTYRCEAGAPVPGGKIEFSQSVDGQGTTIYTMKINHTEAQLVANGELDPLRPIRVNCDKDQLNLDVFLPEGTVAQEFRLTNQGEILLSKITLTQKSDGNPIHRNSTCDRIQQ